MDDIDSGRLPEPECEALFRALFPGGFAGDDVFREIAPEGWADSPLIAIQHPSIDVCFEESVRMYRNLRSLFRDRDRDPGPPEPTREEIAREWKPRPIEPQREVAELVGLCLWDIFSDNHEVRASDGIVVDLGSFRGSAGFIAEVLNSQLGRRGYGYLDFYMGTGLVGDRADLKPVYRMILRRLKEAGLTWRYECPRLHLVDFSGLRSTANDTQEPDWAGYEPSGFIAEEERARVGEAESSSLHAAVDDANRAGYEALLRGSPPATVAAFREVYGHDPEGWPPLPPAAADRGPSPAGAFTAMRARGRSRTE